jgi:DNA-binding response OmpR family regulator
MSPPSPLNILLAEDERSVAFSISFALKADGHKIEIVSDGEEALSELTRKPGAFDLLITDHSMPRMNGVELVKRLRETEFRGRVIVLSAHLSAENRAAYAALGVDTMIPKPFDVHQLRAAIRQIGGGAVPEREARTLSVGEVYELLRLGLAEAETAPTHATPSSEGADQRSAQESAHPSVSESSPQ